VFAPRESPAPAGLKVPLTVRELCSPITLVFVIESPLSAVMLDGILTPSDEPPKTRLEFDVVERFSGVPAIAGPFRVSVREPTLKVPLVRVRVFVMVRDAFRLTPNELFIIMPPVPSKVAGSSIPVVWDADPLYCNLEFAPYVGTVPAVVADPSIDRVPLIVVPVIVFAPLPERVRFVYGTGRAVCAPLLL
jgi:hypothetical protein